MKIKEFFESKEWLAIHCDTKEKAETLVKAFDDNGYTWSNGYKYTVENYWNDYKEGTCYDNKHRYCDREYFQNNKCIILEFEDIEGIEVVDHKPETSKEIKFEMTSKEAIKRLRQETIPATYNQDFDKEECLKVIEEQIKESDNKYEQLKQKVKEWHDLLLKSGIDSKGQVVYEIESWLELNDNR